MGSMTSNMEQNQHTGRLPMGMIGGNGKGITILRKSDDNRSTFIKIANWIYRRQYIEDQKVNQKSGPSSPLVPIIYFVMIPITV